jgi:hypothetical protein
MTRIVKDCSAFSPSLNAQVVSVACVRDMIDRHYAALVGNQVNDLLEQGAQRGLWEMDIDQEKEVDIIVMR